MVQLSIKHDLKRLRKQLSTLSDKKIKNITNRALNKAGKKVLTESVRSVSRVSGIQQKKLRKVIKLTKSNYTLLSVKVSAFPKPNNLIEFVAPSKVSVSSFNKKKGVQAKAWRDKREYKNTFIVRGKNSGKLVVVSKARGAGNKRSNWSNTIYGPSVPKTFIKTEVRKANLKVGIDTFTKEFKRLGDVEIHKHLNKGPKR